MIDQAIEVLPNNPAGYNDKGQILRILRRDPEALESLDMAIKLSNGLGTVAAQAYTQRALMRKYAEKNEEALADFQAAANLGTSSRAKSKAKFCLGSMFARQQAVKLNPYAALCNSMLKRMMNEISTGKSTETNSKCG